MTLKLYNWQFQALITEQLLFLPVCVTISLASIALALHPESIYSCQQDQQPPEVWNPQTSPDACFLPWWCSARPFLLSSLSACFTEALPLQSQIYAQLDSGCFSREETQQVMCGLKSSLTENYSSDSFTWLCLLVQILLKWLWILHLSSSLLIQTLTFKLTVYNLGTFCFISNPLCYHGVKWIKFVPLSKYILTQLKLCQM